MAGDVSAIERPSRTPTTGDFVIRDCDRRASASSGSYLGRRIHPETRLGAHPTRQRTFPNGDTELAEGTVYTSLRDLIGRSTLSLTRFRASSFAGGGGEVPIRNQLAKSASYAYLLPTASEIEYYRRRGSRNRLLRRLLGILACGCCVDFVSRIFSR
ncbi:hypothetical protein Cni_G09570 [Canna indica]|uniref:Uncharacterized protein n=1 Tax=Canna indica TaxID=4628 RepID=A0AAQ3K5W4_9LILI|nr:hypothetical protein Cni_G09570 [Canna indica]